ncbi:hypothetical protein EKH79_00490 [Dyella dinghuensis]|uniref:Uncharacterized protein n=2 Tax=Dyella dinghuensis TaxID=1920169 RepID=A0A432LXS9_9GAMM|nr:hypothetical protein EKH79_00490 [Dyella dinghuensis]
MSRIVFTTLLLAALCCEAAHAKKLDVMTQPFEVEVDLDPTGHVTATRPMVKLPDELRQLVASTVITWQFQPFQKNGQPVAVTTWLRTRFHYFKQPRQSRVFKELLYVGNGPYIESRSMRFPHGFLSHGIDAIFVMQATVEPDGSIDHIRNIRSVTSLGKPASEQANDVAADIATWKARPVIADGAPIATRVTISRAFVVDDDFLMHFRVNFWDTEPFKPASDSPDQSFAPIQMPGTELATPSDALVVKNARQAPTE